MVSWVNQLNFWGKGPLIALYAGRDLAVIRLLNQVTGDPIADHVR